MKRVLSLGDIACDKSENVDGENGVFTQARSRRGANKSKKTKQNGVSQNADTQTVTSQNGDRHPSGSRSEASSDHRKVIINELLFFVFNNYCVNTSA